MNLENLANLERIKLMILSINIIRTASIVSKIRRLLVKYKIDLFS